MSRWEILHGYCLKNSALELKTGFSIKMEMILHWSFGIFHVVQNEFLEFKIFNNSIVRLKGFQEKPGPLFGFQKIKKWKKTTFSFLSYFSSFASEKLKKKRRKSPWAASILSGMFLYSRILVGENFLISFFIFSPYQNYICCCDTRKHSPLAKTVNPAKISASKPAIVPRLLKWT